MTTDKKMPTRRPHRTTAVAVPGLALAVLLAGCGGSDDPQSDPTIVPPTSAATSAPASPSPSASASTAPLSTADAVARAQALAPQINVRAGDLPGFIATPADPDDDKDLPAATLAQAATCFGMSEEETKDFFSDETDESEVASPDFTQGKLPSIEISTKVDVSEAGGTASTEFSRFFPQVFSDKGADCLGTLFVTTIEDSLGDGTTVSLTSSDLVDVPTREGQRAAGVRVRLRADKPGSASVGFEFNFAAIYQDDVSVTLTAVGTGQTVAPGPYGKLLTALGTRLDDAVTTA